MALLARAGMGLLRLGGKGLRGTGRLARSGIRATGRGAWKATKYGTMGAIALSGAGPAVAAAAKVGGAFGSVGGAMFGGRGGGGKGGGSGGTGVGGTSRADSGLLSANILFQIHREVATIKGLMLDKIPESERREKEFEEEKRHKELIKAIGAGGLGGGGRDDSSLLNQLLPGLLALAGLSLLPKLLDDVPSFTDGVQTIFDKMDGFFTEMLAFFGGLNKGVKDVKIRQQKAVRKVAKVSPRTKAPKTRWTIMDERAKQRRLEKERIRIQKISAAETRRILEANRKAKADRAATAKRERERFNRRGAHWRGSLKPAATSRVALTYGPAQRAEVAKDAAREKYRARIEGRLRAGTEQRASQQGQINQQRQARLRGLAVAGGERAGLQSQVNRVRNIGFTGREQLGTQAAADRSHTRNRIQIVSGNVASAIDDAKRANVTADRALNRANQVGSTSQRSTTDHNERIRKLERGARLSVPTGGAWRAGEFDTRGRRVPPVTPTTRVTPPLVIRDAHRRPTTYRTAGQQQRINVSLVKALSPGERGRITAQGYGIARDGVIHDRGRVLPAAKQWQILQSIGQKTVQAPAAAPARIISSRVARGPDAGSSSGQGRKIATMGGVQGGGVGVSARINAWNEVRRGATVKVKLFSEKLLYNIENKRWLRWSGRGVAYFAVLGILTKEMSRYYNETYVPAMKAAARQKSLPNPSAVGGSLIPDPTSAAVKAARKGLQSHLHIIGLILGAGLLGAGIGTLLGTALGKVVGLLFAGLTMGVTLPAVPLFGIAGGILGAYYGFGKGMSGMGAELQKLVEQGFEFDFGVPGDKLAAFLDKPRVRKITKAIFDSMMRAENDEMLKQGDPQAWDKHRGWVGAALNQNISPSTQLAIARTQATRGADISQMQNAIKKGKLLDSKYRNQTTLSLIWANRHMLLRQGQRAWKKGNLTFNELALGLIGPISKWDRGAAQKFMEESQLNELRPFENVFLRGQEAPKAASAADIASYTDTGQGPAAIASRKRAVEAMAWKDPLANALENRAANQFQSDFSHKDTRPVEYTTKGKTVVIGKKERKLLRSLKNIQALLGDKLMHEGRPEYARLKRNENSILVEIAALAAARVYSESLAGTAVVVQTTNVTDASTSNASTILYKNQAKVQGHSINLTQPSLGGGFSGAFP